MDTDDLEPRAAKPGLKDLDVMSIDALEEYIAALKSEIARSQQAIENKRAARDGAQSVFKI